MRNPTKKKINKQGNNSKLKTLTVIALSNSVQPYPEWYKPHAKPLTTSILSTRYIMFNIQQQKLLGKTYCEKTKHALRPM